MQERLQRPVGPGEIFYECRPGLQQRWQARVHFTFRSGISFPWSSFYSSKRRAEHYAAAIALDVVESKPYRDARVNCAHGIVAVADVGTSSGAGSSSSVAHAPACVLLEMGNVAELDEQLGNDMFVVEGSRAAYLSMGRCSCSVPKILPLQPPIRYFVEFFSGCGALTQAMRVKWHVLPGVEAYPDGEEYRASMDLRRREVKVQYERLAASGLIGGAHIGVVCTTWSSLWRLFWSGTRRKHDPLGTWNLPAEVAANEDVAWVLTMVHRLLFDA